MSAKWMAKGEMAGEGALGSFRPVLGIVVSSYASRRILNRQAAKSAKF